MDKPKTLVEEKTTGSIIGSFFDVHRAFGFGYRESIYSAALERDLRAKGHQVEREVRVMLYYRGKPLAVHVLDMVVDKSVVVEAKATEFPHPEATRQLFSYLCSTALEVGLVLYFGCEPSFVAFSARIGSSISRRNPKG